MQCTLVTHWEVPALQTDLSTELPCSSGRCACCCRCCSCCSCACCRCCARCACCRRHRDSETRRTGPCLLPTCPLAQCARSAAFSCAKVVSTGQFATSIEPPAGQRRGRGMASLRMAGGSGTIASCRQGQHVVQYERCSLGVSKAAAAEQFPARLGARSPAGGVSHPERPSCLEPPSAGPLCPQTLCLTCMLSLRAERE